MSGWTHVCSLSDLVPERGVAALLGTEQVALFRLLDDSVRAVQQRDPFSGANVLSRGLVGTAGEVTTVASPMHKQVWNLDTGECLDPAGKEPQDLLSYPVRLDGDKVMVGQP